MRRDSLDPSWRAVPGFPGIYADEEGEIWSCRSRWGLRSYYRKRSAHWGKYYLYVMINLEGKRVRVDLHRLVALAFHPNPDNLPVVRHKDGLRENCRASNLKWGTWQENTFDAIAHGTHHKIWERTWESDEEEFENVAVEGVPF